MSTIELPQDAPTPRLCHVVKWTDYDSYGFNLHAEKARSGQYIGVVDHDSPAQYAGLKNGDRIIEVNGVNIANENHRQVVERIKAVPNETKLLVLDNEAGKWYKQKKIIVKSTQPNVLYIKTPFPRPAADITSPAELNTTQSSLVSKTTDSKSLLNSSVTQPVTKIEPQNRKSPKETPQLNGESSGTLPSLSSSCSFIPQTLPKSDISVGTESIPASIQSAKSFSSQDIHAVSKKEEKQGLNLNMSVSEMREFLAARKKEDPRKLQIDMRRKYEIIQQM